MKSVSNSLAVQTYKAGVVQPECDAPQCSLGFRKISLRCPRDSYMEILFVFVVFFFK